MTGFQTCIEELIKQARADRSLDVIVYCLGTTRKVSKSSDGIVTIKQYPPNLSIRDAVPLVPTKVFPFLVDLFPLNLHIIRDVMRERPDVVHTFQTFSATDLSALVATKLMRLRGRK